MTSYVTPSLTVEAPRVADFRDAVRRASGADFEVTWRRVCSDAGVPPGAATMSLDQLAALADAVTNSAGVLGVMGRSLAVRLTTHRTLAALKGPRS
ncbi:hypothetical protein [Cellulomonas aerilata]|uniref:Uncharacterized protein n=1 Tax=Cellulomonas aerilata TaxID=515326 RepID=A0A512DF20_9CELL|nr:hypothetical protein [Cellulomonas aerilata]GEO35089.1 hypothetical protein CAE01nite_28140 [Cellulomonas aerilata]